MRSLIPWREPITKGHSGPHLKYYFLQGWFFPQLISMTMRISGWVREDMKGVFYFPKRKLNLCFVRLQHMPVHENMSQRLLKRNRSMLPSWQRSVREQRHVFLHAISTYRFFVVIHFMTDFKDIDLLILFWFLLAASYLHKKKSLRKSRVFLEDK